MNFAERMGGAFGSADAYRDAAAGGTGRMIGYVALLIVVATAAVTVKTHIALVQALELAKPWVREHVPEIRIQDGKVTSPAPQPYVQQSKEFTFILDTTGQTTALDPKVEQGVLLTATEIIYRRSAVRTETYSLAQVKQLLIAPATIETWISTAQQWLWVAIAIAAFTGLWITKLLQVFFWSLLGLLLRAMLKRAVTYRGLLHVGFYALTVPVLAESALFLAGVQVPGPVVLALYLAYLTWGVSVQPEAPQAAA